jgi:hypothetical protein
MDLLRRELAPITDHADESFTFRVLSPEALVLLRNEGVD